MKEYTQRGAAIRAANIKKFKKPGMSDEDAYEAYREFMRNIGKKGGQGSNTGGFYANRELARIAGAEGGRVSRRTKKK